MVAKGRNLLKGSIEYNLSTKTFAKQITARETVKFKKYNHGKSRKDTLINFP